MAVGIKYLFFVDFQQKLALEIIKWLSYYIFFKKLSSFVANIFKYILIFFLFLELHFYSLLFV